MDSNATKERRVVWDNSCYSFPGSGITEYIEHQFLKNLKINLKTFSNERNSSYSE